MTPRPTPTLPVVRWWSAHPPKGDPGSEELQAKTGAHRLGLRPLLGTFLPTARHWAGQLHGARAQSSYSHSTAPHFYSAPALSTRTRAHLQMLGGALMEPSVAGGGGPAEVGQKLLRGSTKLGDMAAVLGKAGAARLAR